MIGEPLVPFVHFDDFVIVPAHLFGAGYPPAPVSIKPFGTLVATGVYLGAYLALRQGRRLGLDDRALTSFIFWVVAIGFVGGHALDTIFYYPGRVLEDPLSLLRLWEGLSSFGGFIGAACGVALWRLRHKVPILPYADVVASALPVGWAFGRAGCAVAHDHPGIASDLWLAVRYPDGGRFDLGLLEFVQTLPLAIAFVVLRRNPRPWGFYVATMCLAYAPSRLALDFLRAHELVAGERFVASVDPRYGPFTPAQWASLGLLVFGAIFFFVVMRRAGEPESLAPPPVPRAFQREG